MTQSKIHLLGLIVLYLGVGSCSAKKHKILLKIDALDTGAAGCTSLYGCPWLAPALSTHSSEDDDSKGSDLAVSNSTCIPFPIHPGPSPELQTPIVPRYCLFLLSLLLPLRGRPASNPAARI